MPTKNTQKTFSAGKQNRDNDPRVIPNGEYIRLVNGRIARSEGSSVGALENTRGNEAITSYVDVNAVVLGSIRDVGENKIYYFVKGSEEDGIWEYDELTNEREPLIRSSHINQNTLNFNVNNLITGVNLIGDGEDKLLLWTDNFNEPRKINIARAKRLYRGQLGGFTKADISVALHPPLYPPNVNAIDDADLTEREKKDDNLREKFVRFAYRWKDEDNAYTVFSPFSDVAFAPGAWDFDPSTGTLSSMENEIKAVNIEFATGPSNITDVELLYKEDSSNTVYVVESFNKEERGWGNNVVLGAIRVQEIEITDNTVKTYEFDRKLKSKDPIERIELGGNELTVLDYTIVRGADRDPDSIVINDAVDFENGDELVLYYYTIAEPVKFSTNKLYRALHDDELQRVFDNVPLRAKSQEIIDNRVVYGNYVDRYDLVDLRKEYEFVSAQEELPILKLNITADVVVGDTTMEVNTTPEIVTGRRFTFDQTSVPEADRLFIVHQVVSVVGNTVTFTPAVVDDYATTTEVTFRRRAAVVEELLMPTVHDPIVVDFNARIADLEDFSEIAAADGDVLKGAYGQKNLKSDRNYELGIVYLDDLGRQSPILTSQSEALPDGSETTQASSVVNIPPERANKVNRLSVEINSKAPEWATHYRFFVKNTKGLHYNIIPIGQPHQDPNEVGNYLWFPMGQDAAEKVQAGDYLIVKIKDGLFNENPPQGRYVKVEEIGPKGVNFLETTTPYLDPDNPEYGIRIEQPEGLWMKVSNRAGLVTESTIGGSETTIMEPNGIRGGSNYAYRPWIWSGNRTAGDWRYGDEDDKFIDVVHYYPDPNRRSEVEYNGPDQVVFGGEYDPDEEGAGPIRFSITVLTSADDGGGSFEWHRFQNRESGIEDGRGVSQGARSGVVTFTRGDEIDLEQGITITFNATLNEDGTTYRLFGPDDRFTCTARRSFNPLWRYDRFSPLSANRDGGRRVQSIRSYAVVRRYNQALREDQEEVVDGSTISFGVKDGVGRKDGAAPMLLDASTNVMEATNDYDDLEEFFFEEGYWNPNSGKRFPDSDDGEGNALGLQHFGFWRGSIIDSVNDYQLTGSSLPTENFKILEDFGEDGKLFMVVQSNTYSPGRGKSSTRRIRVNWEERVAIRRDETGAGYIPIMFETEPPESALDVYYEIPETFTCQNGVHFGNTMGNYQEITYVDPITGQETMGFGDVNTRLTETDKVTSITVDLYDYYNCFAYNNGIESSVIRDEFGENALAPGAKGSAPSPEYKQAINAADLIFSEPFNTTTNTNGLNSFSSTKTALGVNRKSLDEADGTIQKLFAKDTDLVVFQEDKVSRVLASKDALYNADGTTNLTGNTSVLGQTVPYVGEFGISKQPESFAVYGNSIYFTDRNRGSVLRLAQNGITEISNYGMRDFFRDEMAYNYGTEENPIDPIMIGAYDDYHDQYVLSIREPLQDFSVPIENMPLRISKQAFTSRTDACRFPEEDLQFQEVYEFWSMNEIQGFQLGDLIYSDVERGQSFNGDNNWFVWYEDLNDIQCIAETDESALLQTFTIPQPGFPSELEVGQEVELISNVSTNVYNGTIVGFTPGRLTVRYVAGTTVDAADVTGADFDFNVRLKWVVNIDSFGYVRQKLDCHNVFPPNHDAVRVSIRGYTTPEEACASGLVVRIVYHNGDDATPDRGDSIFDSPYAVDEYFDGEYERGRTQKRGWYKMFDGSDLDDYVIRILQGKVVEKIPCAAIEAGRTRVLTSEHPIQRGENEVLDRLYARVCSVLPTQERYFKGDGILPVVGDVLYEDNFTNTRAKGGYYTTEEGWIIRVNEQGIVNVRENCSQMICVDDVVNSRLLDEQNMNGNLWTFNGIGEIIGDLPRVTMTDAEIQIGALRLNGNVVTLGDYPDAEFLWVYKERVGTEVPTERELYEDGTEVPGGTVILPGQVDLHSADGIEAFSTYDYMFLVRVGTIAITTDVFTVETGRAVPPSADIRVTIDGTLIAIQDEYFPVDGQQVELSYETAETVLSQQWLFEGGIIAGATDPTYNIAAFDEATQQGDYSVELIVADGPFVVDPVGFTAVPVPTIGGGLFPLFLETPIIQQGQWLSPTAVAFASGASVSDFWPNDEAGAGPYAAGFNNYHIVAQIGGGLGSGFPTGTWTSTNADVQTALNDPSPHPGAAGLSRRLNGFGGAGNLFNIPAGLADGLYPCTWTQDVTGFNSFYELPVGVHGGHVTPLNIIMENTSPQITTAGAIVYQPAFTTTGTSSTVTGYHLGPSSANTQSDIAIFIPGAVDPADVTVTTSALVGMSTQVFLADEVLSQTMVIIRGVPSVLGTAPIDITIRNNAGLPTATRPAIYHGTVDTDFFYEVQFEVIQNGGDPITEMGFIWGNIPTNAPQTLIEEYIAGTTTDPSAGVYPITPVFQAGDYTTPVEIGGTAAIGFLTFYMRNGNGLAYLDIPINVAAQVLPGFAP